MKKSAAAKPAGTLFVVATPIGNYDDITLRALNALRDCDTVVCEEEKEAAKLLRHYEIDKEIIELNEHNDTESSVECMKLLTQGKKLALISDAGTPLLADPGDILVKAAVKYNIDVRVLPGASSVLTALVRSTFSSKQFVYAGFLNRKNEERDAEIRLLAREHRTIVLMDTPYRLKTILSALAAQMSDRQAYVGCNLTMNNEAHHYGSLAELEAHFETLKFRGEYVIVIEGSNEPPTVEQYVQAGQQQESGQRNSAQAQQLPLDEDRQPANVHNQSQSMQRSLKPVVRYDSNGDPLEEFVNEVPLPNSEEESFAVMDVDDYVPAPVDGAEGSFASSPDASGSFNDGLNNQNRRRDQGDRQWNGNGPRRWNNKKRWDNGGRRQNDGDRRDAQPQSNTQTSQNPQQAGTRGPDGGDRRNAPFRPNRGRPDGNNNRDMNRDTSGGNFRDNGNRDNGGRDGGRPSNNFRSNPRNNDNRGRNNYRDNRQDRPSGPPRDPQREGVQSENLNTANSGGFYDESYDRRENFGNREGANYSRFDQTSRDSGGNRGNFNRGPRGNSRGNFNRGNSGGVDGNRRSDNPVYSHLNEMPPKKRKW